MVLGCAGTVDGVTANVLAVPPPHPLEGVTVIFPVPLPTVTVIALVVVPPV